MNFDQTAGQRRGLRLTAVCAALAAAFALPGTATAFEFDTGNDDLSIRWDNTVRLNVVQRVASQDPAILKNPNYDDGDRNIDRGRIFSRFDVLSEFDIVYLRKYGFRVSAAGWWDPAYGNLDNTSTLTSNHLVYGRPSLGLPTYTDRYAQGPSGEFLDVFGFGTFDIGDVPVNVKLGQTTVFWGESLLFNGAIHSVAYSQNPIDVWKGLATPGAESKELFRPRVGLNLQAQVAQDVSVMAQYFFNWQNFSNQAWRYPESGSYLSIGDALLWGGESQITNATGTQRVWRGTDITPEENTGNWGLAAKWSPQWLDGTLGAYYRRTYDMQPQAMATPAVLPGVPAVACTPRGGVALPGNLCYINPKAASLTELTTLGKVGLYNAAYGSDIDIFGLSISKNVAGISVGAELSYRHNQPLISQTVNVLPAAFVPLVAGSIATTAVPEGDTPGAKGNTMHGLVNALGIINKTPLFDTATWNAELTWMNVLNVTQNEAVYKGRPNNVNGGYTQIDQATKNYFGLALNFTPTWYQVLPGVDLLMPLSWSQGVSGNAAITAGGQSGAGSYGLGLAVDIYQKYRIDLKYVGFYGNYSTCPQTPVNVATCVAGAANIFNGTNAIISDRDFVALTFKTTF
ncbi:MAG TPA: DUF1302 domain-containing protein [Burkholderiaceae bacterium]|nr:DUF1302 domain-containing protein [Burkholderiaceae bacterium]HQR70783.1 DUF1302 domain-containing protein [Burkholderiaceae bacterium]